jgi:hypothetical protein
MTTNPMIAANACMDCPAKAELLPSMISGITGAPVMVVTVTHEATCPAAARCDIAPERIIATEAGILIHRLSTPDDPPPDAA